jgi:hypothetical protein
MTRFIGFICLFLPNFLLFAQNAEVGTAFSVESRKTPSSNIVKLNASSFEKVVVKNALYDHQKNNLPYYLKSNTNSINSKAIGKLNILSEIKLDNETASVIKANFGKYLKSDFQISTKHGISVNETTSACEIIPFKLNELGEVIELINYTISWEVVANNNRASNANVFKSNSVLASGKWYKLAITADGVYKLDYIFLNSLGIDMGSLNPKNIRIYGNGGEMLPEQNADFRYDDLEENAIVVIGESDNTFNPTDHVLFYGKGMTRWEKKYNYRGLLFSPKNNFYSDTAFYYLNVDLGAGKRIAAQNSVVSPTNAITSTYDYYNFHENDVINFVKSGRNMYGEYFDVNTSYSFVFGDNNFVVGDTIRAESTIAGRGTITNQYNVSVNGLSYSHSIIGFDITNYLADFVVLDTRSSKAINNNQNNITAVVSRLTPNTVGWIDKIAINARREIVFNGNTFQFRDKRISVPGNVCHFNVNSNGISGTTIWNISDIINPYQQNFSINGNILSFNANADSLNEYVVFTSANLPKPKYISTVQNQNLHSLSQADYVIISPTQFLPYANRLGALHQQEEGLSYAIATPEQIYNEFSSGKIDASAIRDFTRMLYTRGVAVGKPTKYLLLLGRGSYINKNGRPGNTNLIPTYQTENSVSYIYSVASDDFYGLMDPQEGFNAENDPSDAMDVGVGRIVVSNASQADNVVRKIENYYRKTGISTTAPDNCSLSQNNEIFGDWRNHIMFCADDGDGALHMGQADNLAGKVKNASPSYNIDKVYIDAYKGLSTPGGKRYPDMQAAFNNRVEKGCLIMNYTGHGGEVGLSAERVVDIPTIDAWSNFNTLPLFITATCEFSRYDDPDRVSAGELCLLNPKGGSIAMLTTCRLAFSNFNETLNNRLFDFIFKKQTDNRMPTLGDIIRNTKASLKQNFFYSNFHLLGDPALTLAYPKQKVYTTHINGNTVNISLSDTIKGLSKVTIKGFVGDTVGNKFNSFNGLVYPVIFDKSEQITCQLNDPSSSTTPGTLTPFQFQSQQNVIYKGKVEVKNGDFTFSFIVPKDVSFNYGRAKFSYYATDGYTDANGNYDSVKVGGLSPNAVVDTEGPQVKLYLNSKTFVSGGVTDQDPILMAEVSDSTGINTVGTGFGHDITAVLDEKTNKPYVLNEFYESNLNSYQTGKVKYQLKDIPEGDHTLSFKIWDVQNNSSTVSTDFVVAKDEDLALNMVLNYPNPFTTNTKFFFEHNRNCEDIKVIIQIFTISGKLAKSINRTINCEGFRNEGIVWDGRDDYGDKLGRGVYLYKVAIVDKDNKKAEKIEKLVILN